MATLLAGTVHAMQNDVQTALEANAKALLTWNDITPLARNEWLCWIESAKLIETHDRRLTRAVEELAQGDRRPCCWPGCIHRQKNGA